MADARGFRLDEPNGDKELWVIGGVPVDAQIGSRRKKTNGTDGETFTTSTYNNSVILGETVTPVRKAVYNTRIMVPIVFVFFLVALLGCCFYARRREPKARLISPSPAPSFSPVLSLTNYKLPTAREVCFDSIPPNAGIDDAGLFESATSSDEAGVFRVYRVEEGPSK